jgi:hypothetical protein
MTAAEPSDRRAKPGAVLDQRALLAATTMNAHFLTQKYLRPKKDLDDDYSASSRALEKVLRLGLNDLRPRRKRVRFGRRK